MATDEITQLGANERGGGQEQQERGAGGKVRRLLPRKPPATPYSRPPESSRRRWISKLVDPACRLIAGQATRIFPSFFSKTSFTPALPAPTSATEDQGKWLTGKESHRDDRQKGDLHDGTFKSAETESTGEIDNKLRSSSGFILHGQDENGEHSENNLSEIEQLVKGKRFSRDEIHRLMEIIKSRAGDLPNAVQGEENVSLTVRNDNKDLILSHDIPKMSNEQRHEDLSGALWGSSTPLERSNVQDDIGASPIEIAKAYMGSRAFEAGPSSKSTVHTVESSVLHGNEAAIKPYVPSLTPKTSACWPGAVVQDSFTTPRSQTRGYGLHNFPRTPYSRTILSKSKSRSIHMQGNYSHMSSTPLHQSQTMYLQDKSRGDALEGGYGSVGPIRRIRHKTGVESSSRRPAYTPSPLNVSGQKESSDVREGFLPAFTKSLEPDKTGYTHKFHSLDNKPEGSGVALPTVHMHTSLMARRILEHIDRNPPTPQQKSAELKLATKWKNPESSDNVNGVLSNENNGLLKLKQADPYKHDGCDGKKSILNENQGNSHADRESADKSINVNNAMALPSGINADNSFLKIGNDTRSLQDANGAKKFSVKSTEEDALKIFTSGDQPSVNTQEKIPLYNSSVSKPVLPSIYVNKPESKWTLTSDKSSGFTFPVSASSSVFSEPPTPSILPSFSAGGQHQSTEVSTEPSYSFGSKRSSLVFSFPSTSSTAVQNDAGDVKFSFGSNDKARLSFSSFGKNAICY
ncbi:LOW QUALITY PROTEIN: nuclear pore complex protein NUP1 [Neltuma alba]|uniref:LOW QUALITY PROTEIN: nuclear pore complex protein NUP1 n=1 Tax=Neltuma alba TaxID=207710 RepID=UPI0010A58A2B|nr:LOW QUALITY PROTEIN: nuclear pore complex protein NUP1 [Prosopis alba]